MCSETLKQTLRNMAKLLLAGVI